ncbi:hypothetical protein VNO80_18586 [Phaseolus coccineus]|uniref:Uncharacterized protein n=1 Tax=Phaseolus coccineus TaxID=3886 RepID=A0AAN9MEM6_PHACN
MTAVGIGWRFMLSAIRRSVVEGGEVICVREEEDKNGYMEIRSGEKGFFRWDEVAARGRKREKKREKRMKVEKPLDLELDALAKVFKYYEEGDKMPPAPSARDTWNVDKRTCGRW